MIGNDVIDLSRLPSQDADRAARFWQKVLADEEQESTGPAPPLWAYWAIKESAYKLEHRQHGIRRFNPKRYRVHWERQLSNRWEAVVYGELGAYPAMVACNASYLHAICCRTGHRKYNTLVYASHAPCTSADIRSMLHLVVRSCFPAASMPWFIHAPPSGVPVIWSPNYPEPVPVSLSHHGTLGAIAWPIHLAS